MKISFEEFVAKIHAKNYMGTDDDMPNHFDDWISDRDSDAWIRMGQEYGDYCKNYLQDKGKENCLDYNCPHNHPHQK